jgi:hypothetical protein
MNKRAGASRPIAGGDPITAYAAAKPSAHRSICVTLRGLIDAALPKATSKIWHGGPVWFDGENPAVGYDARAKGVNFIFWNGQAFDEPDLKPVGKYGAAQATFTDVAEIDPKTVRRWLKKAKANVFDSVGFFKKLREKKKTARRG